MRGEAKGPEAPKGSCGNVLYHLLHHSKALIAQFRCKPWSGVALGVKCQVKTDLFWEGSPLKQKMSGATVFLKYGPKADKTKEAIVAVPTSLPQRGVAAERD